MKKCQHTFDDSPLTSDALWNAGLALVQTIDDDIRAARHWYLGLSRQRPARLLSQTFDPEDGPVYPYFVAVAQFITRHGISSVNTHSESFSSFKAACSAELEVQRKLAIALAPLLDAPSANDRPIARSLKLSVRFFRVANDRFFELLSWKGKLLAWALRNRHNEAFGLYVANRLLNDISKAFECRERQLLGIQVPPEHAFFAQELRKVRKTLRELKANDRKILSFVAVDPEPYEDRDGRRVSKARDRMVALAVSEIRNSPEGHETSIGRKYFDHFKGLPDAYDDFESFMRQVRRKLNPKVGR